MAKLVSKVYGDALFSLALEENKLDPVWDEVRTVSEVLSENPDFLPTLRHPDMSASDKIEFLKKAFGEVLSDDMMGLFDVLVRKNRIGELQSILDYFDERAKEQKRIGVVSVQTPIELSAAEKDKIQARILEVTDFASLEIDYTVEPALLGGMVIRIGDQVLDGSIRSELEAMSARLQSIRLQA